MAFTRHELGLTATSAALVFSRVFGLSLVLPGFVAYAQSLPGATDVLVGTALGAYGLTLALMQLPLGWLSDRVGRRPVLLLGTALFVAGSAWAAWADSIGMMLAARLLQGTGAVGSVALAMVGESVAPQRRTMAMALVGIPAGLGFFVGIMAYPGLILVLDFADLFWFTAGVGLLAALPLLWLAPAKVLVTHAAKQATGAAVLSLAAAGFTMNFALTSVLFYLGLDGRSTGTQLLVPLAIALLIMGGLSRQVDKRGWTWQPIAVGIVLLAGGAAGTSIGVMPWQAWATLFFAAHATLSAVIPSNVSRIAGPSGGRGHGLQNIIAYMGTFIAGPVAGYWAAQAGFTAIVLATLALAVAAAALTTLRESPTTEAVPLGSEEG